MRIKNAILIVEEMIRDTIDPYLIDDPSASDRVKILQKRKDALMRLIMEVDSGNID